MTHKTRQCQIEAATRYNKKNSQTLNVRLNNKTDKDIIEAISLHQSKSSYIKSLIREDLKRKQAKSNHHQIIREDISEYLAIFNQTSTYNC